MNPKDPLSNVLYIDLTKKRFWIENRRDLFERWLGGVGVAVKLYEEETTAKTDPLGPENVIVFAVGPLTGLYPMASKAVAVFKSPLTGNYGESHAGGRTAVALRNSGLGAIVIMGASDKPVWVSIINGKVYFRDASALWGMRSSHTVGRIIREYETYGPGLRSIMRIGRAGEKLVRYACVITETFRHFGRLGLGAVFGSKKLKALMIAGKRSIPIANPPEYRKVYVHLHKLSVESDLMKKYHDLGTPMNIIPLNVIGALPTRNLQSSRFEFADNISGERFAETKLGRRTACGMCPVACIHLAALREPYVDEPYFYKTTFIPYDYEPIYALGSMLGISEPDGILRLIDTVDTLGLDAISTGVTLAWATEALKKKVITLNETIVELDWGNYENYIKAIKFIVQQPNDFYKALAKGLAYATKVYGGEDFALTFGGNEMAGYHTGPAAYINFLIGARHSHLDSAGYSLDQTLLRKNVKLSPQETVDRLVDEEAWRQILSSLVVCFFGRKLYNMDNVVEALRPLGYEYDVESLKKLGYGIYFEKYKVKIRDGFNVEKLKIPNRIFEIPTPHGNLSKEFIEEALRYFKKKWIEGVILKRTS